MLEGSDKARILLVASQGPLERNLNTCLALDKRELLFNCLKKAGIYEEDISICLDTDIPIIKSHNANVIVPLGNNALDVMTGHSSIDKYHCSILQARAEFGTRKVIPLFNPERLAKEYGLIAYLLFGASKIKEEMLSPLISIPERKFHLSPDLPFTLDFLERCKSSPEIAVDIETSAGQINTVGFAISKTEAIAIRVTTDQWSMDDYHRLWMAIADLLEHPVPKVLQNYIYESLYFSRYGIYLNNPIHDTMWAMKFLHPELDKGLDNVGRLYTPFPYWKDDNDDWNDIKNWNQHLDYNCKDTTGTLWAYYEQKKDIEDRKLSKTFYSYICRFMEPIREMCSLGLVVDEDRLEYIKKEVTRSALAAQEEIDKECLEKIGHKINVRSPKQLKTALKAMGIALPLKKNSKGDMNESADKKSLIKLKKKYPDAKILDNLIKISADNKLISSYLDFDYDKANKKVNYTLDGHGTETGRWSGYTDPWNRGFNPQTVPKFVRKAFKAEAGKTLIEIDLSQAESRFVAYDSPEPKLMELLEKGADVHKYVASRIFNKPEELINKQERQLGKKSGHSANYGVGPDTFAEACLVEMNLVLTRAEAKRIIDAYFSVFPGIKRRQERIQSEIRRTKKLVTPLGRERFFYDRIGDSTFREGYAYAPQSTIPDITNHLLLYIWDNFEDCQCLLQVHDALVLQVERGRESEIAEAARDYKAWHPEINLAGGKLIIPVDVQCGEYWHPMDKL